MEKYALKTKAADSQKMLVHITFLKILNLWKKKKKEKGEC